MPGLGRGRKFGFEDFPDANSFSVRLLGWLAWIFPGGAILNGLTDMVAGRYDAIGWQVFAVVAGMLLVWAWRWTISRIERAKPTTRDSHGQKQPSMGWEFVFLVLSLTFCAFSIYFAVWPLWFRPTDSYGHARMHTLQCVAAPVYFMGGLHVLIALGTLFPGRGKGSN